MLNKYEYIHHLWTEDVACHSDKQCMLSASTPSPTYISAPGGAFRMEKKSKLAQLQMCI